MSKVVLIEPDTVLARQYFDTLVSDNYEVVVRHNAHDALEVLDDSVSLLVLELQLGAHNGLELLYEIRSYQDLADTPVVILSTVSPSYVINAESYKLLGVSEFLYKPQTSLDELKHAITQLLESDT